MEQAELTSKLALLETEQDRLKDMQCMLRERILSAEEKLIELKNSSDVSNKEVEIVEMEQLKFRADNVQITKKIDIIQEEIAIICEILH